MAFAQPPDRSGAFGPRLDYLALTPAAAAVCYPFLLRAFHAVVVTQAATPSPFAITGATLILAMAFVVPFLAFVLACRPDADPVTRRLAYAGVATPTLFVFLGVVQVLIHSPFPDELVWCALWLTIAFWPQTAGNRAAATRPTVGRWRIVHGITAGVLCLYVAFHLANHLFGLIGPDAHAAVMKIGRVVYRSGVGEPLLVVAMLFQIGTGLFLAWHWSAAPQGFHRTFQVASGALPLGVYPWAHELGFHLRKRVSRHTHRLEFRDRRPERADSRRMEHPPFASLRAGRVFCPKSPCVGITDGTDRAWRRSVRCKSSLGRGHRNKRLDLGSDHRGYVRHSNQLGNSGRLRSRNITLNGPFVLPLLAY
ncbi:hypothetical protein [Bradyrhizobium ottawaense]|uniref:hypothetical protein n=1 Tax=Bradyrhizobium ottawaense TaxID=931866 RepID=UPI00351401B3